MAREMGMAWQQAYDPLVVALVLASVVDVEGYCWQQQAQLQLLVFHCERTRPKQHWLSLPLPPLQHQ